MTYSLIYQLGKYRIGGFNTVSDAVSIANSFGCEMIAMSANIDGHADCVLNDDTGKVACYLADRAAIYDKIGVEPGVAFFHNGPEYVDTYTAEEIAELV